MRWKLLMIVSLVATLFGAGAALGIIFGVLHSTRRLVHLDLYVITTLLIPLAAIIIASIFVYRHTSRRRKLQALITALLTSLLTLTILIATSILFHSHTPAPTPATRPNNIG